MKQTLFFLILIFSLTTFGTKTTDAEFESNELEPKQVEPNPPNVLKGEEAKRIQQQMMMGFQIQSQLKEEESYFKKMDEKKELENQIQELDKQIGSAAVLSQLKAKDLKKKRQALKKQIAQIDKEIKKHEKNLRKSESKKNGEKK